MGTPRLGQLIDHATRLAWDRVAAVLVLTFTSLSVFVGLRNGAPKLDFDEIAFRRTLVAMRHGAGYYRAMARALVERSGAAPNSVKSIRPPTMFLVVSRFPVSSWRWLVGIVFLVTLILAWRLARHWRLWGGPVGVVIVGIWLVGASPLLYLHAELWGLPFAMAAILAIRRESFWLAAMFLVAATSIRELYGILLLWAVLAMPRRFWAAAGICALALLAVHYTLAQAVLAPHGRDSLVGGTLGGWNVALAGLSPADRPAAWMVGVGGLIAAAVGLIVHRRDDSTARVLLPYAITLVALTFLIGRTYWGLASGPLVAVFAPEAFASGFAPLRWVGARGAPDPQGLPP